MTLLENQIGARTRQRKVWEAPKMPERPRPSPIGSIVGYIQVCQSTKRRWLELCGCQLRDLRWEHPEGGDRRQVGQKLSNWMRRPKCEVPEVAKARETLGDFLWVHIPADYEVLDEGCVVRAGWLAVPLVTSRADEERGREEIHRVIHPFRISAWSRYKRRTGEAI